MKEYLESRDLKNYEILIHALKSSSRTIGAERTGKLAQELETACGKEDVEYVLSHHDAFVKEYEQVLFAIEKTVKVTPQDLENDAEMTKCWSFCRNPMNEHQQV